MLLLPLLLSTPVNAQVDPEIHKLCSDVKDYAGCVQTQMSLGSAGKTDSPPAVNADPKVLTPWQKHLNDNPSLKTWVEANPSLGQKKKAEWEAKNQKVSSKGKVKGKGKLDYGCYEIDDLTTKTRCEEAQSKGMPFRKVGSLPQATRGSGGCPAGQQFYKTKGLFGLGARDLGCTSAYEAESLRRQNVQNFQNNLNRNQNCTTNFVGNTAYTNCY